MAIDYDHLKNYAFPDIEQAYTTRDTILYALGIGVGAEPLNDDHVRFTFEEHDNFAPYRRCLLLWPDLDFGCAIPIPASPGNKFCTANSV